MKFYLCVLALFLVAFIQSASSQAQSIPAAEIPPAAVITWAAARKTRLMHNLFHNLRMNWALLDELEQRQIENLGWKPPFISFTYINNDINRPVTVLGPTGEDFLFMHRRMINKVKEESTKAGSSWTVTGWTDCPDHDAPGDWPVPAIPTSITDQWYIDYLAGYKSKKYYTDTIKVREAKMKDNTYLESLTLGELGTILEYELHTDFHVRYAAYNPIGYRIQELHPTAHIDTKWDDKTYDYLADFYSAHVNPTFWMIHGWVEKKIAAWEARQKILNTNFVITWTSTWEMGPMDDNILAALEKVAVDAKARSANPDDGKTRDAGPIVGSVFGGLVLGFIVALIAFMFMLKIKAKNAGYAKANTHEAKPLKGTQANQDENIELGKN